MGTVSVSSVELWQLLLLLNASNGQIQQLVICLCLCVCVFIYEHVQNYTSYLHQLFAHVTYGHISVFLWQRFVLPVLWMT